jgi:hypothetical protein
MKKLFLILTLFYFSTSNGQINNLKDLLHVAELPMDSLIQELQYNGWSVEQPSETYSKDNSTVTGKYPFIYSTNNKKQTLQRVIVMHTSSGYKRARTILICNDKTLLNSIIKNLSYQGFELKQSKPHYTVYHDGNRTFGITDDAYTDDPAPKGCYKLTVFSNAVN